MTNPKKSELPLPIYMRTKYSLCCSKGDIDDSTFNQLLLSLFDCEEKQIPPLLSLPQFIKDLL